MTLLRQVFACLLLAAVAQAAGKPIQSNAPAVGDARMECVPASRAAELLGQYGCVAGRVFRVSEAKNGNQHLTLCPPKSNCSFHAAVSRHDRDKVGDLSYLRGKYVAFDGNVVEFRGHPRIVLRDREQIHVTAGSPPSEFDPAQARARGTHSSKNARAW
jgi:hypothetical protein